MSRIPYASAVGPIMYAMLCTCPNVTYALSMTSRFQSDLGESHWTAVKNFLVCGGQEGELVLSGYTDARF